MARELTADKISTLVNQFVKIGMRMGVWRECSGKVIALIEHDDGWSLEVFEKYSRDLKSAATRFPFPELPEDETDAAIELAGYLSIKLNDYIKARRAADSRSAAATKKASMAGVEARKAKREN